MLKLTGKDLDQIARTYGLKRKRFLFFFKESDKSLKRRISEIFNYFS